MNLKRFFAAIFAAVILSISFLSCDPKEDDPTTNPTPTVDVVKEVKSFYQRPYTEVASILDKKGLIKNVQYPKDGLNIFYFNQDSTMGYTIYIFQDTVTAVSYFNLESADVMNTKLQENANKFISTFEKWDSCLQVILPSNYLFFGEIDAQNGEFWQEYTNYTLFMEHFVEKKSSLDFVFSSFKNDEIRLILRMVIDYNSKRSTISIICNEPSVPVKID